MLSAQLCGECALAIRTALAAAVASGRDAYTVARDTDFGNVDAPHSRWDMYLDYEDAGLPYQRSFSSLLGDPSAPLSVLFAALFDGNAGNAAFYELAALVSDRGSNCQRVHPDAVFKPNGCASAVARPPDSSHTHHTTGTRRPAVHVFHCAARC